MSKTHILGIDPGFGRMGFGCVEFSGGKLRSVDFGLITTEAGTDMGGRLLQISDDLERLIAELSPSVIAIEKLFFAKNTTTAMRVAEARGVVLLAAARACLPVIEIGPAQVKKAITGDGSADKRAMQSMVARLLGLSKIPAPDDAADALAIAITASTMRR